MASNMRRSMLGFSGVANSESVEARRPVCSLLHWTVLIIWLLLICVTLPGCGGGWQSLTGGSQEDAEEKEKEKKPFEIDRPTIQPSDDTTKIYYVKPGHWSSVVQTMKANDDDFHGELNSAPTDRNSAALPIDRTAYRMMSTRPVAMPKGQTKHFEQVYYIPNQHTKNPFLQSSLRRRRGGGIVQTSMELSSLMKPHQFYFVVLTRVPETYGFLKQIDSVRPPYEELDASGRRLYYHVMLPKVERRVPLPEFSLAWTNIAFLLWDDFDVTLLTLNQQQAFVDWLHWGGQLIISGPRSLDSLKNSFLGPYLPVTSDSTGTLDQEAFSTLNDYWSLTNQQGERLSLNVLPDKPILGIEMKLFGSGKFAPYTGQLVAERRIGRGRLVVTAFPLVQRQLNTWGSFDSFLNGCLLRHPQRKYTTSDLGELQITWAKMATLREDARLLTNVRYFSRDAASGDQKSGNLRASDDPDPSHQKDPRSGVAGWNDFSTVSSAARMALKKAAGISIPDAGFVLLILSAYLVMLVPVNWGLFHALDRVEWAWMAAPVIAIGCAVMVVKLAQLDIGFARSRTEIAMLELQNNYGRAHLTRYTALYSSLASTYHVEFDDHSALALPFATAEDYSLVTGQAYQTVRFHRGRKASLTGFRVDSNSTGMLRSEYFVDTHGSLSLKQDDRRRWVLTNGTELTIHDMGVIHRRPNGRLDVAWVGDFAPQDARRLAFGPASEQESLLEEWEHSPATASKTSEGEFSLRQLLEVAQDREHLRPGDMRLVGWTDEDLPGMSIQPKASQVVLRTLVVAHLKYGPLADPKPDVNARPKVQNLFDFEPVDEIDEFDAFMEGGIGGL